MPFANFIFVSSMDYRIFPPEEMIDVSIALPLSKSISNRALVINALSGAEKPLERVASCDDTDVLVKALSAKNGGKVDVGAAGTAMRFLTAYFAIQAGMEVTIDGTARMRQRPIGALVDALRDCGASIEYLDQEGFPPLLVKGRKLIGGEARLPASISSQYVSALLMIAPLMTDGLRLTLDGDVISRPYISMTLALMRKWGVEGIFSGNLITVPSGRYSAGISFDAEADWSAASYWYEIAALSAGMVSLEGLDRASLQGDSQVVQLFRRLGVATVFDPAGVVRLEPSPEVYSRIDLDMSEQPDLVQTLAVTCCFLRIPFRLRGLSTLKIKETDRLEALRIELGKFGFEVEEEHADTLVWEGARHPIFEIPAIDTYQDHRMAMALAPHALYLPGIVVKDAEVVSKSYPRYWEDLVQAGFKIEDGGNAEKNVAPET